MPFFSKHIKKKTKKKDTQKSGRFVIKDTAPASTVRVPPPKASPPGSGRQPIVRPTQKPDSSSKKMRGHLD